MRDEGKIATLAFFWRHRKALGVGLHSSPLVVIRQACLEGYFHKIFSKTRAQISGEGEALLDGFGNCFVDCAGPRLCK